MARKLQTCRIFYAGKERVVARRSYAPPPPRRPNLVISNIDRTPASNGYMTDTENESDTDTDPSRDYFTTDYSSDSDSDAEPPQHVPRVFISMKSLALQSTLLVLPHAAPGHLR